MNMMRSPANMGESAAAAGPTMMWPAQVLLFDADAPEQFELIVHVGAGGQSCHDAYEALGFRHLRLVEGDLGRVAELEGAFSHDDRVAVDLAVIAAEDGSCAWHVTSMDACDGTLAPKCFEGRWPGLRQVAVEDRQGVALGSYLERVLERGGYSGAKLLILDLPIADVAILEGAGSGCLQRFQRILIRSDADVLTAESWAQMRTFLSERHFRATVRLPALRQGVTFWLFVLETAGIAAQQLSEEVCSARQQISDHVEALTQLKAELDRARQRGADLERDLEAAQGHAADVQSELRQQQDAAKGLSAERDQARALVVLREKELEASRQAAEAASRQATLARAARDELSSAAAVSAKELAALRDQVVELSARNQMLSEELTKVEAHVELLISLFSGQGRSP